MKSNETGINVKENTITFNIREERLKALKEKEKSVDEVKENAKKHFEEIFNRI
jgi:hypothetical protein